MGRSLLGGISNSMVVSPSLPTGHFLSQVHSQTLILEFNLFGFVSIVYSSLNSVHLLDMMLQVPLYIVLGECSTIPRYPVVAIVIYSLGFCAFYYS